MLPLREFSTLDIRVLIIRYNKNGGNVKFFLYLIDLTKYILKNSLLFFGGYYGE
jgi:hypothetical protein